jgi:O-antigen polysaccharide polymerase Wzy
MQLLTRFQPLRKRPVMADVSVPLLVTALLWYSSSYDVTLAETVAAFLLCWLPWASYRNWHRGERKEIPLFALLAGIYWLAYAVPLFWGSHEINLVSGRRPLSEEAITASLYLAVTGVLAIWAGIKLAARFRWAPAIRVDVSATPEHWNYLRIIFIVGTLVKVFVPITGWGQGGRQLISNFENMLPVVSFAIFLRYYLRRKISDLDKFLMLGYVFLALVVGVSSGWLGSVIGLGIVCVIVYTYESRKLPLTAALIMLPIILFFQPGKMAFRERYWRGGSAGDYSERVAFWVESSWNMWADAITDRTGQKGRLLADASLSRLSLLQQTANVMEFTPDRVPYQYGRLYSYIGVTLIPRFLWPDKPSVNDANHWYQVSYGLTLPRGLSRVSIAVGTLAESYINFGWLGPVLIMFPLGIFLGSLQRIFLHADSGLLFSSVGAVLVPQLLAVESQMAEYVAGLAQQVFVVLLVLIPVLKSPGRGKAAPARMFERPANQPEILRSKTSLQKPPL